MKQLPEPLYSPNGDVRYDIVQSASHLEGFQVLEHHLTVDGWTVTRTTDPTPDLEAARAIRWALFTLYY